MQKIYKPALYLLVFTAIFLLFMLPFQWYKIGLYNEIFPALDLIIIYYFATYKKTYYWQSFLIGVILDKLHVFPVGTSSIALIFGQILLNILGRWFLFQKYFTNILVFIFYSTLVICTQYIIIVIFSKYSLENTLSLLFYMLTTICSYPLFSVLINNSLNLLEENV